MNKYRQMALKVVYLSIPLLKGDLRIDVRDSGRKNRQLNLWHAGIVSTSGQKKQPSTEAKNVSFHFLSLPSVAGGIWSCEGAKNPHKEQLRRFRGTTGPP